MLKSYRRHVIERTKLGIVAKPLEADQVAQLSDLIKNPPKGEEALLLDLITNRVPAGVDPAARLKAGFLAAIVKGEVESPLINPSKAIELLGQMHGGYNVGPLIQALDNEMLAGSAAVMLKHTLLVFDAFDEVKNKSDNGNKYAADIVQSWAHAEWFTSRPEVEEKITVVVFKVPGETNTDDLSPAPDAWSRPDIPLHALAMLKMPREGLDDNPIGTLIKLKQGNFPLAYVGDVVGTGSSRKSAVNSVLWYIGEDIVGIPNKRAGGFCFAGKIAPIFFNTMEDSGALPIEMDVSALQMGDVIDVWPYQGKVTSHDGNEVLSKFELKTDILLDEVRAGGRINLIIGRGLTARARESLGLAKSTVFCQPKPVKDTGKGYTLAQKIVGKACGLLGVRPDQYCEPKITTVGSQDTTGPMTRDELQDLACLNFQADLVMQSFCHTSAYPKLVDVQTQQQLPNFMVKRGGVSLRPGDGVIHPWMNRMLLPDTVGTGGDSHTRFPIGVSFPGGSGLVAFAAATGIMPLDMPESVLVRFKGKVQTGITLRDLVHAIPYVARQKNLLTVEKKGKKNIFSGRILEIEGLPEIKVEQAFEFSDASAERSAAGCSIKLNKAPIIEYINSNIVMLKWMISNNYGDGRTIQRRIESMQAWLENPQLLVADSDAEYAEVIDIDLNTITEPILCAPNDPDDARILSEVTGEQVDEVFIGSCMTNIGHYRAAGKILSQTNDMIPTRLWLAPPTKMDHAQLVEEGYFSIFSRVGARIEPPGCSLCMGNQARIAPNSTAVSTSTRNFPNRLGNGTNVYLASAELSAVAASLGRLPAVHEYLKAIEPLNTISQEVYRYLNFDQLAPYKHAAGQADTDDRIQIKS